MLTSGQCAIVAYMTGGGIICPSCAYKRAHVDEDAILATRVQRYRDEHDGTEPTGWRLWDLQREAFATADAMLENTGLDATMQYTLDCDEHIQEYGYDCDDCGDVIVEPNPTEGMED